MVRAADIGAAEYERFLDGFTASPGVALAYHYPFYLRFLAERAYPSSEPRFVIARDARGEISGVLSALHVRTADLNVWLSLAYFGPNGGAIVAAGEQAGGTRLIEALVAEGQADARARGCASMTVYAPLHAPAEPYRDGLNGPDYEIDRVAQTLVLPADGAESPWPRKVRYDIRRAASLGVTVRAIADEGELEHVWDIYHQNCQDAGIPVKPREHLVHLFRTAGRHGVCLLAEHAGEIVAGLICFYGAGVLSYYLPCTRAAARPLQPGLLLLDRAVAQARAAGCRLLNFEASAGVGNSVYQFKARCGAGPAPYRVFVKMLGPHVLDDYRRLTGAAIAAQAPHAFVVPFEALGAGAAA